MTEGVFEVAGVYDNTLDREKVLEYAALAESSSSHPIFERWRLGNSNFLEFL